MLLFQIILDGLFVWLLFYILSKYSDVNNVYWSVTAITLQAVAVTVFLWN